MARRTPKKIEESKLHRWRLVENFQERLAEEVTKRGKTGDTWSDPRRQLELGRYLGLYLFGLFNPVVETMRGLCGASELERVQREVCGRRVSLGSFSEAQAVVELELLEAVFNALQPPRATAQPVGRAVVIDSTVWPVLPRMAWAFWRRQGVKQNAVRLHVEFDLGRGQVSRAQLTTAKTCEQAQWQKWARPGALYIGDRNYGRDYQLLAELQKRRVDWVVRLQGETRWVVEKVEALSEADRQAGVIASELVRLGVAGNGPCCRVVQVLGEDETILLATTLPANQASAELIAQLYRYRWQVELFFRWLKCILGCRHWLAESEAGVALQCYLALIAAQLLLLHTGQRAGRRQMELIQFYLLGWATLAELTAGLGKLSSGKKQKS